jgi:hypothetical protein
MTMSGLDASAVTADDISAIKQGLAAVMDGVSASHISDVSVIDASSRRLASSSSARALLGTSATVSFTVSVSLAETEFTDSSELLTIVSATLADAESDSSTLVTEIKAAASSSTTFDDVTGVTGTTTYVVSKPPTAAPTEAPSPSPTALLSEGASSSVAAASIDTYIYAGAAVGLLLFVALGAAWNFHRTRHKRQGKADTKKMPGPTVGSIEISEFQRASVDLESFYHTSMDRESAPSETIADFLRSARLPLALEAKLRELGADLAVDLLDLEEADMMALGLPKLQQKRFLNSLAAKRTQWRSNAPVQRMSIDLESSSAPGRMLVVPAQQQTADVAELFGGAEVSERAPSTISHLPTLVLVFTALLYSTLRHAVQHYPPQFPSLSTRTHLSFAIAPSPRRQR